MCAFEGLGPMYMDEVERWQTLDETTGRIIMDLGWSKPGRFVGNGPFTVSSWRFKRDMRLSRNPHYWNSAAINIDSVSMPSINDPSAILLAFENGSIDWVSDVTAECKREMLAAKRAYLAKHAPQVARMRAEGLDPVAIDRRLSKNPVQNIHAFPAFGTYFFNFNCAPRLPDGRVNPLADARVRRALCLAADKERIADLRGIGEPVAGSLVPPGSIKGYTAPAGLKRDIAQAQRLLADAGFAGGKGLAVIEILISKDGGHEIVAQSLARDWREHLGVQVTLVVKEVRTFSDDVKSHRFMVSRGGWFGDYGDPHDVPGYLPHGKRQQRPAV